MARVLLAWELGRGLGHLVPLAALGRALDAAGHDVSFAVRDPGGAGRLLGEAFPLHQAPRANAPRAAQIDAPRSYGELLHNVGFDASDPLRERVRAWRALVAAARPDALVLDHAPTALLATRGLGVPRVRIGSGFIVPPAAEPMPALRPAPGLDAAALRALETPTLGVVDATLHALGEPALTHLGALFEADADLLTTFAELDHFGARRGADYLGTLAETPGVAPRWPEGPGPRIFAYLRAFEALPEVLRTLRESGARVLAYLGETDAPPSPGDGPLAIEPERVDLRAAVRAAAAVVCHAGHGTVAAGLLAGRPLLMLPRHLEQSLTALAVERLGAGLAVSRLQAGDFAAKLKRLLGEPAFREGAARFAARHAGHDPDAALAKAAGRIASLIGAPGAPRHTGA